MSMQYDHEFIPADAVPRARIPLLQHIVETYASETNKTAGVWTELRDDQLDFRPHPRSSSVRQILVHQILSERRFFAEFVGEPICGETFAAAARHDEFPALRLSGDVMLKSVFNRSLLVGAGLGGLQRPGFVCEVRP